VKIKKTESSVRYRKSEFRYKNRNRDFEDADFTWLRKRTKPADARIVTRAALHNQWKPELAQEFDGSGLKAAEKYARQLIEEGLATTVWLHLQINIEGYLGNKYVHGWNEVEYFSLGLDD